MNISPFNNAQNTTIGPPIAADIRQAVVATQSTSSAPVQTEQAVSATQKSEPTRQQVEEAAKSVNEFLQPINKSINFSLDEDTGITVVKVIDVATKEVIRQIPSEEMLVIAKAIDQMKGLLVQQKA